MTGQQFLDLVDEFGEETGAKWDDLIVKFEWQFELEKIMQNEYQYTDEVMQAIELSAFVDVCSPTPKLRPETVTDELPEWWRSGKGRATP